MQQARGINKVDFTVQEQVFNVAWFKVRMVSISYIISTAWSLASQMQTVSVMEGREAVQISHYHIKRDFI